MTKLAEIEAAALRLPEDERLRLADALLDSLPASDLAQDSGDLLAEAQRRDAELSSGQVAPLSETTFWAGVKRPRT